MPFSRRDFEACICENYLYVIGGSGDFRVREDTMFWYNYKKRKYNWLNL